MVSHTVDNADVSEALHDLSELRVMYAAERLDAADLPAAPLLAFDTWLAEYRATGLPEPNAMTLATADASGMPSARVVLLKSADARGFAFYTNGESPKSVALTANPRAALVFAWFAIFRQVVVTGRVEPVPRVEAEAYFRVRPRDAQLGSWASRQSQVVPDRATLDDQYARAQSRFAGQDVPTPDFWTGWLVRPTTVELWQGGTSRMHDRLRYRALTEDALLDDPTAWALERLSP